MNVVLKKKKVYNALQFTGDNVEELRIFVANIDSEFSIQETKYLGETYCRLWTPEDAPSVIRKGYWVLETREHCFSIEVLSDKEFQELYEPANVQ